MKHLKATCEHCGHTMGSHFSGSKPWPYNTCPATEGGIDFAAGPGTTFEPKEKNDEEIYN